jgi:hypothetical protein
LIAAVEIEVFCSFPLLSGRLAATSLLLHLMDVVLLMEALGLPVCSTDVNIES